MGRLRPILLQMFGDSNMGYTDFPDICSYLRAHTLPDFAFVVPSREPAECPLVDKRHNNSTSEGCFSCFVAFKLHLSAVVNANIDRSINSQHWPTNKWVGLWLQMFGSESLMTVYCIWKCKYPENDPVEDDPFNFIFREHEGHLHYADAALPALTDKSFLSGSFQPTLDWRKWEQNRISRINWGLLTHD